MDIYVDVLLAENLLMNYLIIWLTSKITKAKTSRNKMFVASIAGALYALLFFSPGYRVLYSMTMKVLLSFLIIIIAFVPSTLRGFIKQLAAFYLVSFALGGAVFGLFYLTNTGTIFSNGIFFIRGIPLSILISAGAVTLIFVRLCVIPLYNYLEKRSLHLNFSIRLGDKEVELKGLLDTGNDLYDPLTNCPVIVVEYSAIKELIPESMRRIFDEGGENDLESVYSGVRESGWASRIRLIPFTSLGKEKGMLLGFKADKVMIRNRSLDEVIVAVYAKTLSQDGEYKALLNPELMK